MIKINRDQQGFSVIEGVLVIVIIAAIIGVGLYVSHATEASDNTLNSANVSSEQYSPSFKNKKATTSTKTPATAPAKTTSATTNASDTNQALQADLNSANSSSAQASQDMTSGSSAVNDQSTFTSI